MSNGSGDPMTTIPSLHGKVEFFIDPKFYPYEDYFPEKCLDRGNAGFDLRVCDLINADSNGELQPEEFLPEGFRFFKGDDEEQKFYKLQPFIPYVYNTGLKMQIPYDFYGEIGLRSSGLTKFILGSHGTVDHNYRGYVKVAFFVPFQLYLQKFARVAQIKIIPYLKRYGFIKEEDLSKTDRGPYGFGEYTKVRR